MEIAIIVIVSAVLFLLLLLIVSAALPKTWDYAFTHWLIKRANARTDRYNKRYNRERYEKEIARRAEIERYEKELAERAKIERAEQDGRG